MKRLTLLLVALMWLPLTTSAQNNLSQEDISNIKSYIEQIRTDWQIPGMGVTIFKDGELLLCKGFGVKNLDNPQDSVDIHTLFQIGSVTKSFTAYLLATLVEEGLISWEDRVKHILPDFKMHDPWVTEHIQVKDLTSHKTGIGGQVGTYIPNLGYDRDDVYTMMGLLKP
ncbi:MAG: serine hydrolase, partial [Bacteroidales bacterium]|nr:serine hydrolase [Bacteroidales bacterium]